MLTLLEFYFTAIQKFLGKRERSSMFDEKT